MVSLLLLVGFDYRHPQELEISTTIHDMINAINEKDADRYLMNLNDYYIFSRYFNRDFVRENIDEFGTVTWFNLENFRIGTFIAKVNYQLTYYYQEDISAFEGEFILSRTEHGWEIYFITEEEVKNILN